jgi:HAD superfamily hydrolase (TIGR01484 family)
MRTYTVLATDYDGTVATDNIMENDAVEAVKAWNNDGGITILVTGRRIADLQKICPHLHLFAWIVAENGALLYQPSTGAEKLLAQAPPEGFITALQQKNIQPIDVGRIIVATVEPHETAVLQTIRDMGLELEIIFNKEAVMVLPTGVNKGTGLLECLKMLGKTPQETAGVGDAENDHSFLSVCGYSAAVANAVPSLARQARRLLAHDRGKGVFELVSWLVTQNS